MSPTSYRSFLDDPLQGVRFLRWWSRVSVLALVIGLVFLYRLSFGLSWVQALVIVLTTLLVAAVVLEVVFIYIARVVKSTVYPVKIAVGMGALKGFREACEHSADMVRDLLKAEAAVVAWVDEELQELEPVGAVGFPERWLKLAPHISLEDGEFRDIVEGGQIVLKPASDREPWFSPFGDSYSVVYVPLVSLDKGVGLLAILGDSEIANLRDRRLLGAIGVAIGPALDNARLYEEEKERAERLQQLAQMRSEFLITVSHELRTPLTSIKTSAEMLQEEDRSPPESAQARLISNIVRGANRLSSLIADLVSMARLDSSQQELNLEPVGTGEMVSATCTLIYPLIQAKGQTLDVHFGTPGPEVMVDRRRFEQILVNLVANANRFTPSGGRITVEVREEGGDVIVAVSDTGPGIPEGEREAIFQPFYRCKAGSQRSASGMGMGLAIAKSLAELHGGRIWVESGEGGSTFYLAIRSYEEPAAEPVQARSE